MKAVYLLVGTLIFLVLLVPTVARPAQLKVAGENPKKFIWHSSATLGVRLATMFGR